MKNKNIFSYIKKHTDGKGRFTAKSLPDRPRPTVPNPLGSSDAVFYTSDVPPDVERGLETAEMVRSYLKSPDPADRHRLYQHICRQYTAGICDTFMESFAQEGCCGLLFDLGRNFLYNSSHREPVKFAYLIFSLYGMRKIAEKDPELWQDIIDTARCEEFTFFFFYACRMSSYMPQDTVWELLRCTYGWGRVCALNEAVCTDEEERLWLIKNGCSTGVEYPPASVRIIHESRLAGYLKNPEISFEEYKGAAAIINSLLQFIIAVNPEMLEEDFNTADINMAGLLRDFLHHAEIFTGKPAEALDILAVSFGLRHISDEKIFSLLSAEDCHLLMADCDRIIYSRNWQDDIDAGLIAGGRINYTVCDLAYELEIDIWQRLYDFWRSHLLETELFPYLLDGGSEERAGKVLSLISANINLYLADEKALLAPLHYLREHPGTGESIIIAALTSLYDWPRGIACALLDVWGPDYITPPLRDALYCARRLSNHAIVNARIDALLNGVEFSYETLISEHKIEV